MAEEMITPEVAGKMLDKAIEALENDETKAKVTEILENAKAAHPSDEEQPQRQMKALQELMPLATTILGENLKEWGVTKDNCMMKMMQVQMMAMADPSLQPKAAKVMAFVQGKF
eukprot:TRINITY_DN57544_c0_g1_i1.p3 TRINITY_DN57544_c0_g1~~TRINITY_DN57544_c0_g1_i1.p3  ORF type:complete len:114 (+),score=49.27 TRINITY_DN57544_c0_g1_i1:69-410(+)